MTTKKSFRVGERNTNLEGLPMEITEYRNNKDVTVRFKGRGEVRCRYANFASGKVKAPAKPALWKVAAICAAAWILTAVTIIALLVAGAKALWA